MPIPNRDAQSTAHASLESLESRRLLSATLSHGLLTVDGTRRSDNITVGFASPRTLRVVVNGQESLFARKAVERIRVRAGTGDDGVVFLTNTPYALAVRLVISGGDKHAAQSHARALAQTAPRSDAVRVLGPAEAPLALVRGRYRFRLLLKSPRNFDLSAYLRGWLAAAPKASGTIKLEADVDPQSFL